MVHTLWRTTLDARVNVVHTDLKVGSHVPAQSLGRTVMLESVVCII